MTAGILLVGLLIGGETIAEFRAWAVATQAAYVLGFRALADAAGVECERNETVQQTVDALKTRKDFPPEMTLPRALQRIFIERGCGDLGPKDQA